MANTIKVEVEGPVATLTVDRPEVLNAMNPGALRELEGAVDEIENDSAIRVIILTGAGEKSFVAGADISEMMQFTPQQALSYGDLGQRVCMKLQRSSKVTIAAVNGFALGGGCELAISCDIRIASDRAKFGQPEVKLGVTPGWGGTQRLIHLVGVGKAKELVLLGETIDASEALRIGLVEKVVPHGTALEEAKKMASAIASRGPFAVRMAKQAINEGLEAPLSSALEYEKKVFALCFSTADLREGMKAFKEKRAANFRDE
ncbi:MAG TPA: enoyl-CoA hydratase-related protein [Thermoplasmata archaeon]|nr:enoyl-CoA hydratase-related protein [Thermoplasmata archaeon]